MSNKSKLHKSYLYHVSYRIAYRDCDGGIVDELWDDNIFKVKNKIMFRVDLEELRASIEEQHPSRWPESTSVTIINLVLLGKTEYTVSY